LDGSVDSGRYADTSRGVVCVGDRVDEVGRQC